MKNKSLLRIIALTVLTTILVSCGESGDTTPTIDPIMVMTDVAGTVQAEITQAALLTPSPTIPPPPTATPLPIPEQALPAIPTVPSGPASALPGLSPDNSMFIEDVTVPDGTVFWQKERFTKIWKIENTGTTIWNTSYRLIYYHGEPIMCDEEDMNIYLQQSVDPNNQVTFSVRMTAPNVLGTYVNHFIMLNDKGEVFGEPFYVEIQVGTTADKTPTPSG